jgi:uncharacterized membrane protein HdeD (DUF308 family)
MRLFVILRDLFIFITGIYYFEFFLDYKLPEEKNLLLFFVAIPVIWASISQLWTSYSYKESAGKGVLLFSHLLSMMMLLSTVFLVSAVLNTVSDILDTTGRIMFHIVGWTVIAAMIMYDIVDSGR